MNSEHSDRFQGEVIGLLHKLIARTGEYDTHFQTVREQLRIIDRRAMDIESTVIDLKKRLTSIESMVKAT
ncbi:MAG: hypothetical protein H0V76_00465 [Blastocatellia bacterium]|nr:hypothetical protein [Blastocatellia bacterium]